MNTKTVYVHCFLYNRDTEMPTQDIMGLLAQSITLTVENSNVNPWHKAVAEGTYAGHGHMPKEDLCYVAYAITDEGKIDKAECDLVLKAVQDTDGEVIEGPYYSVVKDWGTEYDILWDYITE